VDDVLVRLDPPGLVGHVPAEGVEQRVDELLPEAGFVVLVGPVVGGVAVEPLDQLDDGLRRGHGHGFRWDG
jgi:hypothetical protein